MLFQLEMLHIMRSVTPVSPTASLHIVFFVLLDLCDVTGKDQSRLEQNRKKTLLSTSVGDCLWFTKIKDWVTLQKAEHCSRANLQKNSKFDFHTWFRTYWPPLPDISSLLELLVFCKCCKTIWVQRMLNSNSNNVKVMIYHGDTHTNLPPFGQI